MNPKTLQFIAMAATMLFAAALGLLAVMNSPAFTYVAVVAGPLVALAWIAVSFLGRSRRTHKDGTGG